MRLPVEYHSIILLLPSQLSCDDIFLSMIFIQLVYNIGVYAIRNIKYGGINEQTRIWQRETWVLDNNG